MNSTAYTYAKDFDVSHDGDIILESKDNVRFYFRLNLLCELSTVFKDMLELGMDGSASSTDAANHEPGTATTATKHKVIPLPNATSAGIELLLRSINHWITGTPFEAPKRPSSFAEALDLSKTYGIHLTQKTLIPLARETLDGSHEWDSFALLALYLVAGQDKAEINAQAERTLDENVHDLPVWIKDAMRKVDPQHVERLLEMHLAYGTKDGRIQRFQNRIEPRFCITIHHADDYDSWSENVPSRDGVAGYMAHLLDSGQLFARWSYYSSTAASVLSEYIDDGYEDAGPLTFETACHIFDSCRDAVFLK